MTVFRGRMSPNIPLERTAGSHSLATAAQRERYTDQRRLHD